MRFIKLNKKLDDIAVIGFINESSSEKI